MPSQRMPLDNSKFNVPPSVVFHDKNKLIIHPVRNLWKGTHCRVLAAGNIQTEWACEFPFNMEQSLYFCGIDAITFILWFTNFGELHNGFDLGRTDTSSVITYCNTDCEISSKYRRRCYRPHAKYFVNLTCQCLGSRRSIGNAKYLAKAPSSFFSCKQKQSTWQEIILFHTDLIVFPQYYGPQCRQIIFHFDETLFQFWTF